MITLAYTTPAIPISMTKSHFQYIRYNTKMTISQCRKCKKLTYSHSWICSRFLFDFSSDSPYNGVMTDQNALQREKRFSDE